MRRPCAWLIVGFVAVLFSLAATAQAAHQTELVSGWQPGSVYQAGDVVAFEDVSYRCIYSHTSVVGWEPPKVPALWQPTSRSSIVAKPSRATGTSRARRIFAPYIHMSETNNDLPHIQAESGIKVFTLAFIVSDGGCSPAWQGKTLLPLADEKQFAQHIERVRKTGGDVIISFGGYVGTELAQACSDPASLAAAYQSVVNKYKAKSLDFDVEASAASDAGSIERRSEALLRLVRANPRLEISFTVPVLPNGMPQTALDLLQSAREHRVPVAVVNLMTMDYGQPVPDGNMAPLGMVAVENAISQMRSLGITAGIGITPMIGMNDTPGETFTLADAVSVLSYARSNSAVRRLSMWSVGRDRGGCVGTVSPTCSGIAQSDWEYTRILRQF